MAKRKHKDRYAGRAAKVVNKKFAAKMANKAFKQLGSSVSRIAKGRKQGLRVAVRMVVGQGPAFQKSARFIGSGHKQKRGKRAKKMAVNLP